MSVAGTCAGPRQSWMEEQESEALAGWVSVKDLGQGAWCLQSRGAEWRAEPSESAWATAGFQDQSEGEISQGTQLWLS